MINSDLNSRADGQAGATLVELLTALAVVALTLAIAANALSVLARSGDRGTQAIARHDMLSRGLDVLRRDIERLERVVGKRGDNPEFVFDADATNLAFVVVEPPYPTEPGPYFAVYSILQRRDGSVLTRGRALFEGSIVNIRRLRTDDHVAVLEGPYRFRFAYLERREGRERWVSEWADRHSLPGLISLEIADLTGGSRPMQPIIFRPRIDAERGCVKEGGSGCTIGTRGVLASEASANPDGRN